MPDRSGWAGHRYATCLLAQCLNHAKACKPPLPSAPQTATSSASASSPTCASTPERTTFGRGCAAAWWRCRPRCVYLHMLHASGPSAERNPLDRPGLHWQEIQAVISRFTLINHVPHSLPDTGLHCPAGAGALRLAGAAAGPRGAAGRDEGAGERLQVETAIILLPARSFAPSPLSVPHCPCLCPPPCSFTRLCDHIADCAEDGVLPLGSLPLASSPQSPQAAAAVAGAVAAAQGCSLSGEAGGDGEPSPLICASEAAAAGLGGGHWEGNAGAAGAAAEDGKFAAVPHIVTQAAVEGLRARSALVAR